VQRGTPSASSASFETLNIAPDLLDVWTTAANNAWAVGEFGFVYRWDGTTWTRQSTPTTASLLTVWAASATVAFAGGDQGVMLRWNGTAWTSMTFPSSGAVLSLWGTSASNVYAVTSLGEVIRFDGTTWAQTPAAMAANPLWAIWGTSATDIWATGERGSVLRLNGTAWSPFTSPGSSTLAGVWTSGADNVITVGATDAASGGVAFRFNGTSWQPLSLGTTRMLTSVWGPGLLDLYVTGDQGVLLRFDGNAWLPQSTGTTDLLWAVSGSPNGVGGAFAVGFNGTIVTGTTGASAAVAAFVVPSRDALEPSQAARANRRAGGALPGGTARATRKRPGR
jgi:trimeric autotransporter adhesin